MENYYWDSKKREFVSLSKIKDVETPKGYKRLEIGDPLVIQYLRFNIKNKILRYDMQYKGEKNNEVIITTRIKDGPQKEIAPEMVNYYKTGVRAIDGHLSISDIGAGTFGHQLCYYDEHYKGQSIQMTVKALELDKIGKSDIEFMKNTISSFSALPYVSSIKLPDGMIGNMISVFSKTYNMINKDDVLIEPHDIDLHFDQVNKQLLRSGRYLLIQNLPEETGANNMKGYSLDDNNQLLKDSKIDLENTYVVLQVNNKKYPQYKDFKLYQSTSKYLNLINNRVDKADYVDNITKMAFDYNDVDMMMESDKIINKYDSNLNNISPSDKKMLGAYINSMSKFMQPKYAGALDKIK